jgi:hypothetical protein
MSISAYFFGTNISKIITPIAGDAVVSSAYVTVLVTDANDNVPVFEQKNYEFTVKEDAKAGELVGTVENTFVVFNSALLYVHAC